METFVTVSMKPNKLQWHLETLDPSYITKPLDCMIFKWVGTTQKNLEPLL